MPKLTPGSRRHVLGERFRRQIETGELRPGQRIAPLRQLARDHDLALNTVRAEINALKQTGLLIGRQGSGNFVSEHPDLPSTQDPAHASHLASPPKALHSSKTRWVALLLDPREHLYGELSQHLAGRLEDHGFRTIQVSNRRDRARIEQTIHDWHDDPPDALVLRHHWPSLTEAIERLRRRWAGRPRVVIVKEPVPFALDWHYVGEDIQRLGSLIIDHLVQRGHCRVGFITHGRRMDPDHPENERKRDALHTPYILALGRALRQAGPGYSLKIHYHISASEHERDPFSEARINRLTHWLEPPDRPTALISNDARLVVAMRAAQRLGLRIPGDLDLIGIGDTPWARAFGFSSVSLCEPILADAIAGLIEMDETELQHAAHRIATPVELVQRQPLLESSFGKEMTTM